MLLSFSATGDVADYPSELVGRVREALVGHDGVPAPARSSIGVEPGSVVVTLTLSYPTQPPADAAHDALKPLIDDPAALEAFLRANGIDIDLTGDADIQVYLEPTGDDAIKPQEKAPQQRSPAFWPVVITAIVLALLLILLAVLFLAYRSKTRAPDDAVPKKSAVGRVAVRRLTPPPSSSPREEADLAVRAPPPAADVDRI